MSIRRRGVCEAANHRRFHFSARMWALCADITRRVGELRHVDMQRILVSVRCCRNDQSWGLQAMLVPLRFPGGATEQIRHGRTYRVQPIYVGRVQMHHVLAFYLPRFLDQRFDEKWITIFHELYHVSPEHAGDIRRLAGQRSLHPGSRRSYDVQMARLARGYLAEGPPAELYDFLRLDFDQIEERHGSVVGIHIPPPKVLPVTRTPSGR